MRLQIKQHFHPQAPSLNQINRRNMTILKKIIYTGLFAMLPTLVQAQAPQKINYQGIGRNAAGNALASQNISLQISILDGATVVYKEKHGTTTNAYGLFNVPLGAGTVVSGTFNTIAWNTGNKFVKMEIDPAGGSAYTTLGTTELLSVPYALYAGQSAAGPQGPAGPAGPQGATGPTGAQGSTGAAGAPGAAGPTGATGATGATGPANTLTIGNVTNGGSAAATITGTAPNQTLNLVLPAGPTGAQGPQGIAGATGPANTIAIGSVTNGGSAAATLTGTAPNQTLNLVLPAGPAGAQGVQGVAGPAGATGATGATGPQGAMGMTGATGPQGPAGPSYTAGSGINIAGTVISAADNSATNEIQTLSLSGNTLTLSVGGGSVTLPGVSGSGTTNYISKFTSASAVGNSQLQDNGTNIGIGAAPNTTDKLYMPISSGTGGLNINKSTTATGSYSAKISQSAGSPQSIVFNYNGTYNFGGSPMTNPTIGAIAGGSGAAIHAATIGGNGYSANVGQSSSWSGGNFRTKDSLNEGVAGLVGVTESRIDHSAAIVGIHNRNTIDSMHYGIYGSYNIDSSYGAGVIGIGFGGQYPTTNLDAGVYGTSNGFGVMGTSNNIGVRGAILTPTTTSAAVYGFSASPGYALYSNGDARVTGNLTIQGNYTCLGSKSAAVPTSKGSTLVYCSESPEIWFEDFGNASLLNGATQVNLDALFLETVKIDEAHPMVVTVTPLGNCNGLYVVPGTTGFEVRELNNGSSNVKFSYRISAKRLNYENIRFGVAETKPMIEESTTPLAKKPTSANAVQYKSILKKTTISKQ
jgi:Collagen triple helix repeat (20 copies)